MRALPGVLDGTIVFESELLRDGPGFVIQTFDGELADAVGVDPRSLVQESQHRISQGVVRGLWLRTDGGEGRLVRCCAGAVLDVAVDLRPGSPTYRQWMTVVLDDVDHRSVWLPAGLAHGFQALTVVADVCCRVNRVPRPEYHAGFRHDDPDLDIPWPLPVRGLSPRDRDAPPLAVIEPMFADWFGALT